MHVREWLLTAIHVRTPTEVLTSDRQKCVCCIYSSWRAHGSYNVALPLISEGPGRNGSLGCGEAGCANLMLPLFIPATPEFQAGRDQTLSVPERQLWTAVVQMAYQNSVVFTLICCCWLLSTPQTGFHFFAFLSMWPSLIIQSDWQLILLKKKTKCDYCWFKFSQFS